MAPGPAMAHRTTRSPGGSGTPGSAHRRQSGPGAWRSNEAPWEQLQWTSASMRLGCAFFWFFFYVLPVVPHKAVAEVSE